MLKSDTFLPGNRTHGRLSLPRGTTLQQLDRHKGRLKCTLNKQERGSFNYFTMRTFLAGDFFSFASSQPKCFFLLVRRFLPKVLNRLGWKRKNVSVPSIGSSLLDVGCTGDREVICEPFRGRSRRERGPKVNFNAGGRGGGGRKDGGGQALSIRGRWFFHEKCSPFHLSSSPGSSKVSGLPISNLKYMY
jgi:hypothetical protein